MNLLTLADGFGDSVAVPAWYPAYIKWPEIIHLMTKGVKLTNLSRYGAGNEYITQLLKSNYSNQNMILVQWAMPNRLDLKLSHHNPDVVKFWTDEINLDPVYNNNVIDNFWITSASTRPVVKEYHNKFISLQQHQNRTQIFIEYATLLLEKHNIPYKFFLTPDSEYLKDSVDNYENWLWHKPFKGMTSFRKVSKYAELDLGITQPIPLIQFDFIQKFIMPSVDLPWRNKAEITAFENMLFRKYNEAIKDKPTKELN
jgi:hypothetical protein